MSYVLIGAIALVVLFLGFIVYSHYKMKNMPAAKTSDKVKTLNPKNFKIQSRNGLVIIDFWASWCAPCKMMVPVLNDIAENEKVSVAKVNVEKYQQLASKYKIKSLPTLIIFKNGKEMKRLTGFKSKMAIMKEISKAV